jgi:hypothetical protein
MRRVVVEEPGERALDLTLVVDVRQVRVTAKRDEACVRKKRRELASSVDGNGPIPTAMEHERRHGHAREERACVAVQLEIQKRRCGLGICTVTLVAAERAISSPLACGTISPRAFELRAAS